MDVLAAILAAATLFLLLVWALRSRKPHAGDRRLQRLQPSRDVVAATTVEGEVVLRRASSSIPALRKMLQTSRYASRWADQLERADLSLRPGEYFIMRIVLAITVGGLVALIGRSALGLLFATVIGAFAFMLPAYWLKFRTQRRIDRINAQVVEAVALIANGVRAGFAFGQSVDVAAKQIGPPISAELNRMLLDINLGSSTEDALSAMNERIGSDDVDMVVTAVLIQRNTGGNLAEVLEQVTETMRDRSRIQREIKTLTASQRLTGWILSLWPAALAGFFYLINPGGMSLLWTTSVGLVLLGIWGTLNMLGIYSIRRILAIDI